MGILTDNERAIVESQFRLTDFRTMFDILNSLYEAMKFHDDLSDAERIAEYKYVTQQLRKYISGRQVAILDCGSDLDKMLLTVESWLSDAPEYGDDRKTLAYNFLRDEWILETYNMVKYLIEGRQGDSIREEDE